MYKIEYHYFKNEFEDQVGSYHLKSDIHERKNWILTLLVPRVKSKTISENNDDFLPRLQRPY